MPPAPGIKPAHDSLDSELLTTEYDLTTSSMDTVMGEATYRRLVGRYNNCEIFVQDIDHFLNSYGPVSVDSSMADECLEQLSKPPARSAVVRRSKVGKYSWKHFKVLPARNIAKKTIKFNKMKMIVDAILAQHKNSGVEFSFAPNTSLVGEELNGNYTIDACFVEKASNGMLLNNNITSPWVFTTDRNDTAREDIHLQILGACHHIFHEDIRRMFIFGMTFENSFASLWYFSRTHSVKSTSFNWIKNPNLFVRVLLAFATATPAQLGVDPTIHKGPNTSNGPTYVYEAPPCPEDMTPRVRFFRTEKTLAKTRPTCFAGRETRVWQVTEVTSAQGDEEVAPGKNHVLKDVWLDKGAKNEADSMDAIFEAIDAFVDSGLEKERVENEDASLDEQMMSFINRQKCFAGFDASAKDRLRINLSNKKYRSLFLKKLNSWKGEASKPLGLEVKHCPGLFKHTEEEVLETTNTGRKLRNEKLTNVTHIIGKKMSSEKDSVESDFHLFVQRQQVRFIYEEVCTTLQNLPRLKDVVDVLCETVDVLHIFLAIGWVHRDISHNNIMAVCNDGRWTVKLADLEFSRKMADKEIDDSQSTVGTRLFMPVEILSRKYFVDCVPEVTSTKDGPDNLSEQFELDKKHAGYERLLNFCPIPFPFMTIPDDVDWTHNFSTARVVKHNFQHDLESVWWILLWVATTRISCTESEESAENLFECNESSIACRSLAITECGINGVEFDPELKNTIGLRLEHLRESMYKEYIMRSVFRDIDAPESYSAIHAEFAKNLRCIQADTGDWQTMEIEM